MRQIIYPLKHSYIRDRLDPYRTLPEVAFKPNPRAIKDEEIGSYFIHDRGGTVVGGAVLMRVPKKKECFFTGIYIEDVVQGRGLGMASYVLAIEGAHSQGETFRNDPAAMFLPGCEIWQRLVRAGVAEAVEPFQFQPDMKGIDGEDIYLGYARVPVAVSAITSRG